MERLSEYFKQTNTTPGVTPEIINSVIEKQIRIKELELALARLSTQKLKAFESSN